MGKESVLSGFEKEDWQEKALQLESYLKWTYMFEDFEDMWKNCSKGRNDGGGGMGKF